MHALQAGCLAELGQCGVAVACAGAALALFPKSKPVRRLVVSILDLKLCAEVSVCEMNERERLCTLSSRDMARCN